eukprot:638019-Prymnesium_polylepis.1
MRRHGRRAQSDTRPCMTPPWRRARRLARSLAFVHPSLRRLFTPFVHAAASATSVQKSMLFGGGYLPREAAK